MADPARVPADRDPPLDLLVTALAAEAEANVEGLLARGHIRAAGELDGFWSTYRRVGAPVTPRGNLVADTHLVALMAQHGIARIWSRDRDLRKLDEITVSDPFADRYRDGFGRR